MASPFQRYQGGIEASTGNLVSAYGQMAQQQSAAIAGLGQNLAEGIKAYSKNVAEDELLTAKVQGIGGSMEFLAKQIKDNPELAPFAESFNPLLKKVANFATMSKAQKQAVLLEAETFQAQIAPALAIFKEGNVSRTRQGVQSALDAKPKVPTKFGIVVEALPYQPDKTPEWNFQNNREYIELTKKNNPNLASLDVEDTLNKFADGWSAHFSADKNLGKSDPKFRDVILKGLSDWKALQENTATDESGATDYAKEAEAYAGATEAPATARMNQKAAEALEAQRKAGKPAEAKPVDTVAIEKKAEAERIRTESKAEIKKIDSLIKQADKASEEGKDTPMGWMDSAAMAMESGILDPINVKGFKEMARMYISQGRIKEVTPSTARMILSELNKDSMGGMAALGAIVTPDPSAFGLGLIEPTRKLSRDEERIMEGAYTEFRTKDRVERAKKSGDATFLKEELVKRKELLESRLATGIESPKLSDVAKAKEVSKATPKPTYEETLKTPFDYSLRVKSDVQTEREMTYAEEKQYIRKWFMDNRNGVIPESLDAVYKAIRPETDVQFMPAPDGGQVMITSKGAQYIAPVKAEKGMSEKEKSEVSLYNYGTRDATGTRIIPEERTKGSGIKLAGFAKGGEKNAEAFQKLHDDTVKARTIIPKLMAMYKQDKLGRTLIPNEMWGEAESLLAQLKAAIRVETVGTGPVALPEHQMILERIGDPRKFFALDTVGKSKLNSILTSMENSLVNNNAGISVTFAPRIEDAKAMEQQARIQANKGKR